MYKKIKDLPNEGYFLAEITVDKSVHPGEYFIHENALNPPTEEVKKERFVGTVNDKSRPKVVLHGGELYVINGNAEILRNYREGKNTEAVVIDSDIHPEEFEDVEPTLELVGEFGVDNFDDLYGHTLTDSDFRRVDSIRDEQERKKEIFAALSKS